MKTLFVLFTIVSLAVGKNSNVPVTMNATYDGFDDGFYYFTDDNEIGFYFDAINEESLRKYKLLDEDLIGESFRITYKIENKKDKNGKMYQSFIIIKLIIIED